MTEVTVAKKWEFVHADKLQLPAKPATEKAKSFLRVIWQKFSSREEKKDEIRVQTELRSIPQKELDWIAPFPAWHEPADEIFSLIQLWLESPESEEFFRLFIAPPGGGLGEILATLAELKGWPVISAPDYDKLMDVDFSWIENIPRSSDVPLVIPKLENLFLRHYNGLEHLRTLIEKLFHLRQRCIVGCNSWLWKYLEVAMHIGDGFPEPYFQQSMSARGLQDFFCDLEAQPGSNITVFRQSDDGSFVLPVEQTAEGKLDKDLLSEYEAKKGDFPSNFIKKLAVESRGIPLVAWAIWRNSLKMAPGEEIADAARDAAVIDKGYTIWVRPFEKISLPKLPANNGQATVFLLLFLLIHDGLPPDVIFELLDFEKDLIVSILHRLKKAGILVAERGLWRISWAGYPEVRRFLAQEDYLLDSM
ncbi:MAG: B3/4 domain-containing protein [Candidatus Rifleibacteriota bacterium]